MIWSWALTILFASASFAGTSNEKQLTLPLSFAGIQKQPPEPFCEKDLFETFHPSWRGSLLELKGDNESPVFARINSSELIFNPATKSEMRDHGFVASVNPEGFVELSKSDQRKRVPMTEPISSIEFFPTSENEGFFVILGWTQVNYYRYMRGHWLAANDFIFEKVLPGVTVKALEPYHVKVEQIDRDDLEVVDPLGNKLYKDSKQFKNLLDDLNVGEIDEMKVHSKEELEKRPLVNTMRAPRIHLLSLFLERKRLGNLTPSTIAQIFTQAAAAVVKKKSPDFSAFFTPLVEQAFKIAFRSDNLWRFTTHFGDVVKIASEGQLIPIDLGELPPNSDGVAVLRFQSKDGRQYILYYQSSARQPLRLVAVGS